jgi:hypothetical protein
MVRYRERTCTQPFLGIVANVYSASLDCNGPGYTNFIESCVLQLDALKYYTMAGPSACLNTRFPVFDLPKLLTSRDRRPNQLLKRDSI